jgi:hypothetical protein
MIILLLCGPPLHTFHLASCMADWIAWWEGLDLLLFITTLGGRHIIRFLARHLDRVHDDRRDCRCVGVLLGGVITLIEKLEFTG